MEPSVVVNNDGSFLVMWASEPGDWNFQVYARLFDKTSNPITSEINVSEPNYRISSIGQGKHVALDEQNNYCVTWSSYADNNFSNILIQMIDSSGQKVGNNIIVSSLSDSSNKYFPVVSSTDDGHFLITWDYESQYGGGGGARIYNIDGYFTTDEFKLLNDQSSWHNVSSDKDSIFLVYWLGTDCQYLQKIKTTGELISDTVRVKYNSNNTFYSYAGGITDVYNDHFYTAPEFNLRNDEDVYLQKFNLDLEPVGSFSNISDDVGSAWQRKSLVKFNNRGEPIVLWEDKRNGRYDLYAQVYDKNFNPVGSNIQINETNAEHWFLYDKKVESLSDGTFVIVFDGSEIYSDDKVFLQLVNISGEKVGQNKLVKDVDYQYDYNLALNINSENEILVCWYNGYGAYLRKYNADLSPLSDENNFIEGSYYYYPFSISIDSEFNILAVWNSYNSNEQQNANNIEGRFFDEDGKETSEIFNVANPDNTPQYLTCKNDNKSYAVLYKDNYRIHLKRTYKKENNEYTFDNIFYSYDYTQGQLNIVGFENQKVFITYNSFTDVNGFYANDNRRISNYYKLHQYDYINSYYDEYNGNNSADIFEDKLIFTYESNINKGTGYDIWANVRNVDSVNFNKEIFYYPSNTDVLYPNYPNPFNLKTKIPYEILAYSKVKLVIYDILGREVKVLVDANQEKGLYEVDFDASGLASGIYFYRLEAFNTAVKKMILLK